jgi:hypothetical protein
LCGIASVTLLPAEALLQALPAEAQELPAAPRSTISSPTPEPGYFTEPSIAINPNNPELVVAVFQHNADAAYSNDSGVKVGVADFSNLR